MENWRRAWKRALSRYDLYLMLLLPVAWYVVFQYGPMYGVQIAFRDYIPVKGITGSDWVGFDNFDRFFSSYYFGRLLWNTVSISLLSLLIAFPIPILLALLVTEIRSQRFKKLLQNITYMPHFISVVVIVGMLQLFLDPKSGFVNLILNAFGFESVPFMESEGWFKTILVGSNIWQNMGWASIIYIAALSGINPHLYEAAMVDGASRLRRLWHISLPGITPIMIIMLILDVGAFMNVGFEKILLMQNDLNRGASDVIQTFIYNNGILQGDFSYSAAVGLFNSAINFTLLVLINGYARRKAETSLW
ncbi:carbohydrate ABC transporter membrane protein 1 (CUT1 family) [Paenibacillus cellulosilyticus]|uniref:Carbohydrate ABC transporter membrane protein 1 (CUT1 family) n=2 Tax=Paenibacillus cellulosilyticus TaxID=375489 RepID=A0A2V2YVA1_9BACL|nr:carbohydrate ABC transporter membrane protein 1 (CUT1 family) [Paenibacillus cellulosilyticus]